VCPFSVCVFCMHIINEENNKSYCVVFSVFVSCLYLINSLSALELQINYVKAAKYKITFHLTINCSFDFVYQFKISRSKITRLLLFPELYGNTSLEQMSIIIHLDFIIIHLFAYKDSVVSYIKFYK